MADEHSTSPMDVHHTPVTRDISSTPHLYLSVSYSPLTDGYYNKICILCVAWLARNIK